MIWLVELWLSSLYVKTIEVRMSSSAGIRMQQPRMVMTGSSFPSLKKLTVTLSTALACGRAAPEGEESFLGWSRQEMVVVSTG